MRLIPPFMVLTGLVSAGGLLACANSASNEALSIGSFDESSKFPAAKGLVRPEDGLALRDGRIVVADQEHGLRVIAADESTRSFGRFAEAGYVHAPPAQTAGPNGVSLEPDGVHALVADVFTGAIYRVNLETQATERIYPHTFGVNTAVSDSTGAIWFTQSTENAAGTGFRGQALRTVQQIFRRRRAVPNRTAFPGRGQRACTARSGGTELCERHRHRRSARPDLSRGDAGRQHHGLSAIGGVRRTLRTQSRGHDLGAGQCRARRARTLVGRFAGAKRDLRHRPGQRRHENGFRVRTATSQRAVAEWIRRKAAREPLLDLFAPDLWAPLPGAATGVILTPGGGPVYVSGLGDALVKFAAPALNNPHTLESEY